MKLSNRSTNLIAASFLVFVFLIAVFSIKDDSLTMDEIAHLPAGYSYLTQKDMRLNPEHPPLLKDLAAFPLLFINSGALNDTSRTPSPQGNIKFPSEINAWKEDVNGQWDFGRYFLYQTGNPANEMVFWGRIPMILLLILLGFYVFKWTKELFGNDAALLALFFFSFSPTFLAHGRLVTTDIGAAFGVTIATYYFLKTLLSPVPKNIILAGIAFGIAQLLKFSAIILIPFFGFLGLFWWLIKSKKFWQTVKIGFLVFLIGFLLIWPVYQYHTWNYPPEKQLSDTNVYLKDTVDFIKKPIIWASDKPILRPYALYFTGLSLVFHRVAGGNTTYFLGEISNLGWRNYFPIVYLIKEPLAFHILTLIALLYAAWLIGHQIKFNGRWKNTLERIKNWIKFHFSEFAMLIFIGLYWLTGIKGNLNVGIRHLLPVFPFTIILVGAGTINWMKRPYLKIKCLILMILILWQSFSVLSIYPHFLAYFNELVGGANNGYKYVVDSNLDWGQDLKRLEKWVEANNIEKIYVDYFGGGSPEYYLKTKYAPWWGNRNPAELLNGSYLAVSATFLQGGKGEAIPGFNQPSGYYRWLDNYMPVAKIGYSIFVYRIDSPPSGHK